MAYLGRPVDQGLQGGTLEEILDSWSFLANKHWKIIPLSFLTAGYDPRERIPRFLITRILLFKFMMTRLTKRITAWYKQHYKPGVFYTWYHRHHLRRTIIARNKKDDTPDVVCTILYHPHEIFWNTVFETLMTGGMEVIDGERVFVVPVHKLGTTQEAVSIFCAFKDCPSVGKNIIRRHLKESEDVDDLTQRMSSLLVLADTWDSPPFYAASMEYVSDYLSATLDGKGCSKTRLRKFLDNDPIVAEYLFKSNFDAEKKRGILGASLNISHKMMGGFKKSQTLEDLKQYLQKKKMVDNITNIYDQVSDDLKARLRRAQKMLQLARLGRPVGTTGWYISGDDIAIALQKLADVRREADQYISLKLRDDART